MAVDPSAGADESHQSESALRVEHLDPVPCLLGEDSDSQSDYKGLSVGLSSNLSSEIYRIGLREKPQVRSL